MGRCLDFTWLLRAWPPGWPPQQGGGSESSLSFGHMMGPSGSSADDSFRRRAARSCLPLRETLGCRSFFLFLSFFLRHKPQREKF